MRVFALASAQSDYLCSSGQVHAQTFLPKVSMMSSEHHLMMHWWHGVFGWWHLHHSYIRVGGIKGWMQGGRGSQFWGFRCRAYGATLIASRVLWCALTLGQPGILYLLTTEMCWVHWLLSISIFQWSNFCFYWLWLFEWPSSQWAQPKGLEYLVANACPVLSCCYLWFSGLTAWYCGNVYMSCCIN